MMLSWSTILLIIFAGLSSSITADDPCWFQDVSKGVIDLTSLGRPDGKAAYPDRVPPTGSNHSFRLVLFRGGKSYGRKSPKTKEKRILH
jgi:hypothetical protein